MLIYEKCKWKVVFWGGSSYFSDNMFDQYKWQGWTFENLSNDNDFADVTLACEDGQQGEARKVDRGSVHTCHDN